MDIYSWFLVFLFLCIVAIAAWAIVVQNKLSMILRFGIVIGLIFIPVFGQEEILLDEEINLDDGENIDVIGDHPLVFPEQMESAANHINYWAEELLWRSGIEAWLRNDELNFTVLWNNSTTF